MKSRRVTPAGPPFLLSSFCRFYKTIEDAYTYANRTLLNMLLKDQQLVPRLRSLKRFFFLSQSFFVTHLLDLAGPELRRPAKSASIVKLQSLLELTLNTDIHGEDTMFREDVKVTMAGSGLYEWLLKIISVNGVIGGDEGEGMDHVQDEGKKGKEDKKQILGESFLRHSSLMNLKLHSSHRCFDSRLQRQVPALISHFSEDHPPLPIVVQISASLEACGTNPLSDVVGTENCTMEGPRPKSSRIRSLETTGFPAQS